MIENADESNGNHEQLPEDPLVIENYPSIPPERHGFVTAWLYFCLIANSLSVLFYLFAANMPMRIAKISILTLYSLIVLGVFNITFSIWMLSWKKKGFYGSCIIAIIAFLINISTNNISPLVCTIGLSGPVILYCIFQIKKNGISAWSYMK